MGVTTTCAAAAPAGNRAAAKAGDRRPRPLVDEGGPVPVVGTAPASRPTPASIGSPSSSMRRRGRVDRARSTATAPRPASRNSRSGGRAAQQCTITGTPAASDEDAKRRLAQSDVATAAQGVAGRSRSGPVRPGRRAATARRAGAARTHRAPAGDVGHVRCAAPRRARRRDPGTAPWSCSSATADRQLEARGQRPRPGRLHLERSGVSVRRLGQRVQVALQQVAGAAQVPPGGATRPATGRRRARPAGRPASPAPRPIKSAPGPRAGSSGRCGRSGSSPRTSFAASAMSVPGSEPTPVADPGRPRPNAHCRPP